MTKEQLKMAEDDGCKTVMEVALWYKGYLQGCLDTLRDDIKDIEIGEDHDTDTNRLQ